MFESLLNSQKCAETFYIISFEKVHLVCLKVLESCRSSKMMIYSIVLIFYWFIVFRFVRTFWEKISLLYRVTHKGWAFRDDCTEFVPSVFLYSWFPAIIHFFLCQIIIYDIERLNLTLKQFQVVFTVSCFVGNPAYFLKSKFLFLENVN